MTTPTDSPFAVLMNKRAMDYGEASAIELLQRIAGRNDFDRELIASLELTRAFVAGALYAFACAQDMVGSAKPK